MARCIRLINCRPCCNLYVNWPSTKAVRKQPQTP